MWPFVKQGAKDAQERADKALAARDKGAEKLDQLLVRLDSALADFAPQKKELQDD
jgi:hypothetical protein